VVDVSNPQAPVQLGSLDTPDDAIDLAVVGDLVFVADRRSGLRIVDVSIPASPVEIAALDTPGSAEAVAVVDGRAYVADGSSLRVVDVANPAAPEELGALEGAASEVQLVGAIAYVAGGDTQIRIIDVSDPSALVELSHLDRPVSTTSLRVVGPSPTWARSVAACDSSTCLPRPSRSRSGCFHTEPTT
jgi:hypothetical protein